MTRLAGIVIAAVIGLVGWVLGPTTAQACACGALVMDDAVVSGETALITYFDGVETIDMSMNVQGSASDAAWIMPVPRGTHVSLGTANFDLLAEATKPEIRYVTVWGSGSRGPESSPEQLGNPVSVESVKEIGPFEVTTLTGSDPAAVGDWLVTSGYSDRNDLDDTFGAYLGRGYQILAVKLLPESGEFRGALAPLRMRFATDEVTYPIQLSRHASVEQSVELYLASDHKMAVAREAAPSDPLQLKFAGELAWDFVDPSADKDGKVYVTAFKGELAAATIVDDFVFERAPDNEPYRAVEVVEEYRELPGGNLVTVGMLLGGPVQGLLFLLAGWALS